MTPTKRVPTRLEELYGKGAGRVIFLSPILLSNMPERILNARNRVLIGELCCQNGSRHRDVPQSAPPGHVGPAGCFRVLSPVLTSVYDGRPQCAQRLKNARVGRTLARTFFYAISNWRHGPKERWEFGGRRSQPPTEHGPNTDQTTNDTNDTNNNATGDLPGGSLPRAGPSPLAKRWFRAGTELKTWP